MIYFQLLWKDIFFYKTDKEKYMKLLTLWVCYVNISYLLQKKLNRKKVIIMPIGVFLDSLAVLIGGLCGAKFKHKIPQSINYPLTIIFGAMNEAMTGDITILLSKAIMDIFAGAIFACTLGYAMNLIIVPQVLILGTFFYLAKCIMPLISANMLADFTAIGGILTFVIGLSIAEIKKIKVVNLLPTLLIIFPISCLFELML